MSTTATARPTYGLPALIAALAACFGAAGVGGWLTAQGVRDWYPSLTKPGWTPPDGLFGPVWTALYAAMAVASWRVWRWTGPAGFRGPLGLFALQLALNVAWSGFFFGLRSPGLALLDIVALWAAILATLVAFARVDRLSAWLLAPYLAWVGYAAALNFAIWRLN